MAGGKKKKKPAANPARGFATTSIASKPKAEIPIDVEPEVIPESTETLDVPLDRASLVAAKPGNGASGPDKVLNAEEFEKELENQELQLLVEKHAQKSKRDALRQKTRLETDRRVLRSQAEHLSTRKWLPAELMEEILDLIQAEGRFSGQAAETSSMKQASEEDLAVRLWTLQQALVGAGFLEDKVNQALRHILDISDKVGIGNKDTIWGVEEAVEWLARECSRDDLPDYESGQRKSGRSKALAGQCFCISNFGPKC